MKRKRTTVRHTSLVSFFWYFAGLLCFLAVWQIVSVCFGAALIFPGPLPVARRFAALVGTVEFRDSLGRSFLRVLVGMATSAPLGLVAGLVSGMSRRVETFLRPLFQVVASTPVMAVILIAFLFLGDEATPVFTAFLVVFPVMAANTIEGIRSVDPKLRELFRVYHIHGMRALHFLYAPSILPFVLGGLRSSLSLCWKVVVAAEVLVQPTLGLGSGMQEAKASLETPELFAWTVATVVAAGLSEALLSGALRLGRRVGWMG